MFLRNDARSKKTEVSLPRMLVNFLDETLELRAFIRKNLEDISVEKVHFYIHDKLLVRIASSFLDKEAKGNVWDIDEDDKVWMITIKGMLEHYKLSSLSQSTVWSWMQALGMRFGERKKTITSMVTSDQMLC